MKRKEWLPVRCCCTPTKIFGFLSVELGATTVLERSGRLHHIKVTSFSDCRPPPLRLVDGYVVEPTQKVSVELEKAVYSDDRPIQFWRSIDGFVEARDTKALVSGRPGGDDGED